MINLTRTRDPKLVKLYTGKYFFKKIEKLIDAYFTDNNGQVDFEVKGRKQWGNAKDQLILESHGKCAYCEADTTVVAHGDVEHFRPKSKYWWLAYCYDNFTFSCQICNQIYKGNSFPITGPSLPSPIMPMLKPAKAALPALVALICPDPVVATDLVVSNLFNVENAHFVNPYVHDPEIFFAWDANAITQEVKLIQADASVQSANAVKAAESYLGINRQELLSLRWNAYDNLAIHVLALGSGVLPAPLAQKVEDQILRHAEAKHSFSGMHRYFLRQWGIIP